MLIHLIDAYNRDIKTAYQTIQKELAEYTVDLSKKPQIIAINKIDGLDKDIVDELAKELKSAAKKGTKVMAVSAQSGEGTKELLREAQKMLEKTKAKTEKKVVSKLPVIRLARTDDSWKVSKTKEGYLVKGKKIERFALRTDFENEAGIQRLRDIMRKMGIMHELERKKIKPGDKVFFDSTENHIEF